MGERPRAAYGNPNRHQDCLPHLPGHHRGHHERLAKLPRTEHTDGGRAAGRRARLQRELRDRRAEMTFPRSKSGLPNRQKSKLMKMTLKNILRWDSALALVAGFTATAIAGPSPQYWQQMEILRAENAKKPQSFAPATKPAETAMPCGNCKTTKVEDFSATNISGKLAPHYTVVGAKHECATCGGAMATVRRKTTDDMTGNCPICAKAKAAGTACCNTRS